MLSAPLLVVVTIKLPVASTLNPYTSGELVRSVPYSRAFPPELTLRIVLAAPKELSPVPPLVAGTTGNLSVDKVPVVNTSVVTLAIEKTT